MAKRTREAPEKPATETSVDDERAPDPPPAPYVREGQWWYVVPGETEEMGPLFSEADARAALERAMAEPPEEPAAAPGAALQHDLRLWYRPLFAPLRPQLFAPYAFLHLLCSLADAHGVVTFEQMLAACPRVVVDTCINVLKYGFVQLCNDDSAVVIRNTPLGPWRAPDAAV